ncbi:hypothetical protein PROFUN_16494 [Planoprotostelium fungivorum]|uniref:Uncharacterized protein n=1 Tax=Planoprotostelium fungivorum TaxID=1890364 RepID=A0A2P6MQB4_9EUKA|nr:hypothetical protein PROFUN_16494 [Planoprotostelium fungivorum]
MSEPSELLNGRTSLYEEGFEDRGREEAEEGQDSKYLREQHATADGTGSLLLRAPKMILTRKKELSLTTRSLFVRRRSDFPMIRLTFNYPDGAYFCQYKF